MKKSHKFYFYLFFSLTLISGIGLWITQDFFKQQTPYGLLPHPWQSYWLDFHLLSLPTTILNFGAIIVSHIIPQFKKCTHVWKRYSGILLTFFLGVSTASGYGIQVHSLSGLYLAQVHEWSSLVSIPILIIHIFCCLKMKQGMTQ